MAPEPVVLRAVDVHIDYRTAVERSSIRDRLIGRSSLSHTTKIQAVRGVSLDLHRGETLGVIGHNGCGKSSLMRGLAGLVPLSSGDVQAISRPTLLGIAAALNPKLTGRRNLTLGCLAQGMSLDTINGQIEELIDFTGLGDYIDVPMQAYSTGMKSRLAFTVATAITPDILLLDEALAGGDREFRDRATRRLDKVREDSGAVIIVSHSMAIMRRMCHRIIWMSHGEVVNDGPTDEVLEAWQIAGPEQVGERGFDRGARRSGAGSAAAAAAEGRFLRTSEIDLPPQDFIVVGLPRHGSLELARQLNATKGVNVGRRKPAPGVGRLECDVTRADFVPDAKFWLPGRCNGHHFSGYAVSEPKLAKLVEWSPQARVIVHVGDPLETLRLWFSEYRDVAERGDAPAHPAMKDREFFRHCSFTDFADRLSKRLRQHADGLAAIVEAFGSAQVYVIDRDRRLREPEACARFLSSIVGPEVSPPPTTEPTKDDVDHHDSAVAEADLIKRLDGLRAAFEQAIEPLPADQRFQ